MALHQKDSDEEKIKKSLEEDPSISMYDRIKKRPELILKTLELIKNKWADDEVLSISIKKKHHSYFIFSLCRPEWWPWTMWKEEDEDEWEQCGSTPFKRYKIYGRSDVIKLHNEMYKIGKRLGLDNERSDI